MGWVDKITRMIGGLKRNFKELDAFYEELWRTIKIEHGDIVDGLVQIYKERGFRVDLNYLRSRIHIKALLVVKFPKPIYILQLHFIIKEV